MKNKDVKIIIETIKKPYKAFYQKALRLRYDEFVKGFEKKGFSVGFVPFEEVIKEITKNEPAKIYNHIPNTNDFVLSEDKSLNTKLLLPEIYQGEGEVTFDEKKNNYEICLDYYNSLIKKGNVKYLVNPSESMKSQDKKWLIDVKNNLNVPVPNTYLLNNLSELEELVEQKDKNYILKPRLGFGALGIYVIDKDNYENIKNLKLSNYVVQENLSPLLSEVRLLYGPNQNFLTSYIYFDRIMPWDKWEYDENGVCLTNRKNKLFLFEPTNELLEESKKVLEYSKIEAGCVDWLIKFPKEIDENNFDSLQKKDVISYSQKPNLRYLAEVNGFGTNFAPNDEINYNEKVAKLLADKYLR